MSENVVSLYTCMAWAGTTGEIDDFVFSASCNLLSIIITVSDIQQHLYCRESGSRSVERRIQWSLYDWFQEIGIGLQWLGSWLPVLFLCFVK